MIDISNEFLNELENDNRDYLLNVKITLENGKVLNITQKDIWDKGFKLEDSTSAGGLFTLGAAVTAKFSLVLNNIYETYSEYDFSRAKVEPSVGLQLSNRIEALPLGKFIVDNPSYDGSTITLICLDHMTKFDVPYSNVPTKYPTNIGQIVRDICVTCNVPVNTNSAFFQDGIITNMIVSNRPSDSSISCGDVIAMAAQIGCSFAKMDRYGALNFDWYDMQILDTALIDGGDFTDTLLTTYKAEDAKRRVLNKNVQDADGGTFSYTDGDTLNGGDFRQKYHVLYSTASLDVSTDEITITGVQVTEDGYETNSKKLKTYFAGQDGYVISIARNQLISGDMVEKIAKYMYGKIGGMSFRPLEATVLNNPSIESGDVAFLVDRKQNIYRCFISNRKFSVGEYENISCDAETPTKNSQKTFSQAQKIIADAQRAAQEMIQQASSNIAQMYQDAQNRLGNIMANSLGLFQTQDVQSDGSTIFYMHNKPTVAESTVIWKQTADGFSVSTDSGKTWNAGVDSNGNMIVQVLSAVGINADWINAGTITGSKFHSDNEETKNSIDIEGSVITSTGYHFSSKTNSRTKKAVSRMMGGYFELMDGASNEAVLLSGIREHKDASASGFISLYNSASENSFFHVGMEALDGLYPEIYSNRKDDSRFFKIEEAEGKGARMTLCDPIGRPIAVIGAVRSEGGGIILYDANHKKVLDVHTFKGDRILTLYDMNQGEMFEVFSINGKTKIRVRDEDGSVRYL